ncbi:phospholipase A [Vibrio sp. SCSIO 43136]|uniref:phospholipase A n=1 Tax=Vibrio sp. SCSIO 43136 TaxID=2819101 RepID=UPI0020753C26|nr:phospholipase A [Vibrio sp. SCSIO 43136]USD64133.1 phospholipase A [Vibrio sp. SCSIO 43136]
MQILPKAILGTTILAVSLSAAAKSLSTISSYEDTYVIGSYTSDVNKDVYVNGGFEGGDKLQPLEAKMKFSFSVPLFQITQNSSVIAAYTQTSLWQVSNTQISSPFRETNYNPQLFVMYRPDLFIFNSFEFGYKHESNGQTASLSRSWDRAYIAAELLDGPLEYGLHMWTVFGRKGENPDIETYYAPWEAWTKLHTSLGVFDATGYYNFDSQKWGLEAGYTFYFNELIGLYFQVYSGYGETLIEHDFKHTRVGAGLKLVNWQ